MFLHVHTTSCRFKVELCAQLQSKILNLNGFLSHESWTDVLLFINWESVVANVTDKCFFSMNPFHVKRKFPIFVKAIIAFFTRKNNGVTFMLKFVILDLDFFTIWFWLDNCRIWNRKNSDLAWSTPWRHLS